MKTALVYFAFGKMEFKIQCISSIFSLINWGEKYINKYEILIFTDDLNLMDKWLNVKNNIKLLEVTQEEMKKIIEPTGFILLFKIEVIRKTLFEYKKNCIFIDTDIIFKKDPFPIFQKVNLGQFLFQKKEHLFKDLLNGKPNNIHNQLGLFLKDYSFQIKDKKQKVNLNEEFIFNTGVVGVPLNKKELLLDLNRVANEIYSNVPIFIAEQVAFNLVFQKNGQINTLEQETLHYWGKELKFTYTYLIKEIFRRHFLFKNPNKIGRELVALANKEKVEIISPWFAANLSIFGRIKLRLTNVFDKKFLGF